MTEGHDQFCECIRCTFTRIDRRERVVDPRPEPRVERRSVTMSMDELIASLTMEEAS